MSKDDARSLPGQAPRRHDVAAALLCYVVTDSRWLSGRRLPDVVAQAIRGGATCVQLREKTLAHSDRVLLAREVLAVCRSAGVPFLVDDDVECALEVGADGVHVGQSDASCRTARSVLGPHALIGVSSQTVSQAIEAEAAGATYLGVGAIWGTPTKTDASLVGVKGLRDICSAVTIPVVAIGGITRGNIPLLHDTGACGVAVVSEVFGAEDIEAAASGVLAASRSALLHGLP